MASGALKVKVNNVSYDCIGDAALCTYEQVEGAAFPVMSNVVINGPTMVVSGSGFITAGE